MTGIRPQNSTDRKIHRRLRQWSLKVKVVVNEKFSCHSDTLHSLGNAKGHESKAPSYVSYSLILSFESGAKTKFMCIHWQMEPANSANFAANQIVTKCIGAKFKNHTRGFISMFLLS